MKKLLPLLSFSLVSVFGYAQITFERTYGGANSDWGTDVQQTSDSGFIATGCSFSYGDGSNDVYLIKTDKYGNAQWYKTFGGNGYDVGISVKQTMDGGYILTGSTSSYGAGSSDVYLIRTNSVGDTLWTRTFGGNEDESGNCLIENPDGSIVIAGKTLSYATGWSAAYIIKTDANGDTLWTKVYEKLSDSWSGDIKKLFNGYYLITGATSYFSGGGYAYILKLKENGDTVWTKALANTFGVPNPYDKLENSNISMYNTNGFIFSGTIVDSNNKSSPYLMKTDTSGNLLWFRKYGSLGNQYLGKSCQSLDGGFLITGFEQDSLDKNIFLIKTNNNGDSLWSTKFCNVGDDFANSAQKTADNGFILCGGKINGANHDLYLIKTNENGL